MEGTLKKGSKKTVAKRGLFSVLALSLLALLFSTYAVAQLSPPAGIQAFTSRDDAVQPGTPLAKVSSDLLRMRAVAAGLTAGQSVKSTLPEITDRIIFKNGDPLLEFILNTTDDRRVDDVVAQLQTSGCAITEVYPNYGRIYGTCDLSFLDRIATDDAISTIYPAYKPIHRTNGKSSRNSLEPQDTLAVNGLDNRADVLMKSDQVRSAYNINGSGIKVGVISDSFDRAGTGTVSGSGCARSVSGTSSQTSGYLPSAVYVLKDNIGNDNKDEGRAMSELIYDVGPGATLMFHASMDSEAAMASAVHTLRACGAKIIVDDITFDREPIFQDGIIAQAAQSAVSNGVAYFSSAGNDGPYGVSSEFSDDGTGWHNFGSGNTKARISLGNNQTLTVVLQWNDPFSGTLGLGASRDLDLYLVNAGGNELASSTNTQGCSTSSPSGDPFEYINYKNTTGSAQDTYLKVRYKCGSKSNLKMRIVDRSNGGVTGFDRTIFNGPTVSGHPMADGVVAVAAMNVSSQLMEPFSSLGGNLPIYFSPTGTPVSQTRTQPIITAPDGVNTSVPDFAPFEGTSASAPNAAAVGALVLSYRAITPAVLAQLIASTATAIGSEGWYPLSGYGLVNALKAFQFLDPPGPATLISPTGIITTSTPPYSWHAVSNSSWYYLSVYDSTGYKIQQWYKAADAGCGSGTGTCSVKPDIALAPGSAKWWVQTYNASGNGPWSAPLTFTESPLLPDKAVLESPSGAIGAVKPTYTWGGAANSSWYYLLVNDSTGTRIQSWYKAADVGCPNGSGTCTVTPDVALFAGSGKWWVQTWNASGFGPWSDPLTFTLTPAVPPKAVLLAPSGTPGTNTPMYSWNAVSTSTWYLLWVYDNTGYKIQQWYKAADAGCGSGTGTCSARPDIALAQGAAKWWIQTYNANGNGPWSDGMTFTSPAPVLPGKAILSSPSGTISTSKPIYTWNADPYATWYYLWVDDNTGTKIQKWYKAAEAGCPGGTNTCSATTDIALVAGSAKWWIETWNANGEGPWSDAMTFTVSAGSGFID